MEGKSWWLPSSGQVLDGSFKFSCYIYLIWGGLQHGWIDFSPKKVGGHCQYRIVLLLNEFLYRKRLDPGRTANMVVCKDYWMSRRSMESYRLCEKCLKYPETSPSNLGAISLSNPRAVSLNSQRNSSFGQVYGISSSFSASGSPPGYQIPLYPTQAHHHLHWEPDNQCSNHQCLSTSLAWQLQLVTRLNGW